MSGPGFAHVERKSKKIEIRGAEVLVTALTFKELNAVTQRFPEFRAKLEAEKDINILALLEFGDDVMDAIIAAANDAEHHKGDEATAKNVSNLDYEEKIQILMVLLDTMIGEKGFGPFVELAAKFLGRLGGGDRLLASTSSRARSS